MSIYDFWNILKRRIYIFVLPTIAIAVGTLFFALSIEATYRSEATILIEDQDIPKDIIGATMTNYASQQIQLISQRLFTVANITKIIEKFDVYGKNDSKEDIPDAKLASRFRRHMDLELVSEEILDPLGRSVESAVAFTLSFDSRDPEMAQVVTEELVELFLSENQRSSAIKSAGVSQVLQAAVNNANQELLAAEAALASFKIEHEGALPELQQLNMTVINRTEQQLSDLKLRLQELQQRKLQLSVQLSGLSPSAPVTLPSGETVMGDRDRLQSLLVDYRRKSAVYEAGHPDLVRLEREIEVLRRNVGGAETYALLQEQLRKERNRLSGLRERYSADHPDIKSSEAAISKLETQLAATSRMDSGPAEFADNPAYVLVKTQLQSVDLEVSSLLQKQQELQATLQEHEDLMRKAPRVEVEYQDLSRALENARSKHADLQAKLRTAEVAADMEQGITGRRFSVIEPPLYPIEPEPRNRFAIVFLGFLLAGGVGVGCVALAEYLDTSIRSSKTLENIVGAPPLAVIPYLTNSGDIAQARNRRILVAAAFFASTALLIVYALYFL